MTTVLKVEIDIITSITASQIGRVVIMYVQTFNIDVIVFNGDVETFKIDVIIFIGNIIMCLTSH
jgi:hypothetical protein